MRGLPDELAFWLPAKAAIIALADTLSARQQQKFHANLIGLAQRRAEKNDLKTANFLYELAGYDPVEEGGAAAKQKKPDLKIIVDNTKP
jgi:hypothetical protein